MTPSDKDKQDSRNRPGGRIDPASGPIIDLKANRVSDTPPRPQGAGPAAQPGKEGPKPGETPKPGEAPKPGGPAGPVGAAPGAGKRSHVAG